MVKGTWFADSGSGYRVHVWRV